MYLIKESPLKLKFESWSFPEIQKLIIKYIHKINNKKNILFLKSSHFFSIITFPKQNKETATTQNSDTPVPINKLIGKNKIKKKEKLIEFINKIKLNFLLLI